MFDKDPFDYLSPYIVSIGSPDSIKTPEGSGTLVTFTISLRDKVARVYAVQTATHVLEKLNLLDFLRPGCSAEKKIVTLSKLKDRSGSMFAVLWQVGIATELDNKHMRFLTRNLKASNAVDAPPYGFYEHSERDVALLILAIDELPINDITNNSKFYDLETNPPMPVLTEEYYNVLFKGACSDNEVKDNVLENTGVLIIPNGTTKYFCRSKIPYLSIDLTDSRRLDGGSGAGVWVFYRENEIIKQRLCGVFVEHISTSNRLSVIDISYVVQTLLPKIKKYLIESIEVQSVSLRAPEDSELKIT